MSRVLAVRLDNLGDVVLAGPAVRALARSADRVCLLAGPNGAVAAQLLPGVDEVAVMRAPWIDLQPEPIDRGWVDLAVAQLRSLRCDQAVIFTSAHQSPLPLALLLRMAGVRHVGGVSVDHAGSLLDVRIREDLEVHEVERGLALARACGFTLPEGDDRSLRLRRTGTQPAVAAGFVLLHPGGTAPARCWSEERWAALGSALVHAGHRVVVAGSEAERGLCQRVASAAGSGMPDSALSLAGRTSLAELVELIAAARCLVVGNTGPAHLAAAVGTPVVSLFAPTVPAARWRPWQVPHVLLGDQAIACAGCRAVDCPVAGHPCLESVAPGAVLEAVERLLAETARQRPAAPPRQGKPAPAAAAEQAVNTLAAPVAEDAA